MHRLYSLTLGAAVAALTLTAGTTSAASLTRQPYLQRVGMDTATVAFRLDAACVPVVRYGTHGSIDQQLQSESGGRNHAFVLTGLQPGTEYTYVVDACGARTNPKRFSTAPTPDSRSAHFLAVGDMGTGGSEQRAVLAAMVGRRAELFLALGDIAYSSGTEAEFQSNFFVPMAPLLSEVPLFTTPGNHEYVTAQAQPYLDNLYLPTSPSGGERYYSFDWGPVHFVSLDSNCTLGLASADRCTLTAQKQWAQEDLAASQAPWKVVFFHHPPWSSGDHGSSLKTRREWAPLFEKYGVDLVLTGHDHHYERTYPMRGDGVAPSGTPGIPYLVVGNGGASLRPLSGGKPSWAAVRNDTDHGYLDVRVEGGTLTGQVLTPSGKVVDSFSLIQELPPPPEPGTIPATPGGQQPGPSQPSAGNPSTSPPNPIPGGPGPSNGSDPDDLGPDAAGCSTGPMAALLPAGLLLLAGALRHRRQR
jgi:acid phosphatase type 7